MNIHENERNEQDYLRRKIWKDFAGYNKERVISERQVSNNKLYPVQRSTSSSILIDYSNGHHVKYLSKRRNGISNIRHLVKVLHYSKLILYKAIHYMDKIYLESLMPIELIDNVSTICVLFAVQFNECCSIISLEDLFTFVRLIPQFNELEIQCLIALDYDLASETPFDFINSTFSHGVIFSNENGPIFDVNSLYSQCICFMDKFIEDDRALDFTPYILAMTIIKLVCEKTPYFNLDIFQSKYDINFKQNNFAQCYCIVNYISSAIKERKYTKQETKSKYTCRQNVSSTLIHSSTSTLDSVTDGFF